MTIKLGKGVVPTTDTKLKLAGVLEVPPIGKSKQTLKFQWKTYS